MDENNAEYLTNMMSSEETGGQKDLFLKYESEGEWYLMQPFKSQESIILLCGAVLVTCLIII